VLHLDVGSTSDSAVEQMRGWGYDIREGLLTVVPRADFDLGGTPRTPAPPTQILTEGDLIELGDRSLEVVHLPGRSTGSIGAIPLHTSPGDRRSGGPVAVGRVERPLTRSESPGFTRRVDNSGCARCTVLPIDDN
jgi:hypothetical protein